MRIITLNLNGIRSAIKKGFFSWLKDQAADCICLQEIKAQECDLTSESFQLQGYQSYFHCAEKKGYSGVGIYSKKEPLSVTRGLGWPEADQEGRYVALHFEQLTIASLYLPSGTTGPVRQAI